MEKNNLEKFDQETWKQLNDSGISREILEKRYECNRRDWRPFGNNLSIRDILEQLKDEINGAVQGLTFRWEYVSEEFWTDSAVARKSVTTLLSNLSLIVIDPISLFDDLVFRRFTLLNRCFENDRSAIMVLSPFTTPEPNLRLIQLIRDKGAPFFDQYYYEPSVPPSAISSANWGVNIADVTDIKRLVLITLGQYARRRGGSAAAPHSVYLGV
jgi:hypothetical protein